MGTIEELEFCIIQAQNKEDWELLEELEEELKTAYYIESLEERARDYESIVEEFND